MEDAEAFSDRLETWLQDSSPKTVGGLGDLFVEKSFAVTILFLMFVPALPLPTGGLTHVFEVITVLLAGQMVLGRQTIWLPRRWRDRQLGATTTEKAIPFMMRRIRWFEGFSRPRLAHLFSRTWARRVIGVVLITFAVGAALSPPFSGLDTLPALGAVAVSLSIILEDVVVLLIGLAIGGGGIALSITVGAALVQFLKHVL